MRKSIFLFGIALCTVLASANPVLAKPPIYITFLWHMHQPIYWPYENINTTESRGVYSYSVVQIHQDRTGPYTSWPADAVEALKNAGLDGGAQVIFSGSLIENLNNLAGAGKFQANWNSRYQQATAWLTPLGSSRLEMVGFGYFHPLMGLLDYNDIRKQVQKHKDIYVATWNRAYSKGIFPPENAFSIREVPALVDEGFQWVLVDNIHFDRACTGYPYNSGGNLYPPNQAEQINPNPGTWVQLNGVWAPTKVSAPFGYLPHYVQYIDPANGTAKKIIAVPTARYEGNEDGRGGFGALNYENVLSQLEPYNNDDTRPILVVLHHDGDNYGGGTDSYYHSNFQNFVNWLLANPTRFKCTTINDYLARFPVPSSDVINVEDGSWAGADNGDPEFLKWNGDPNSATGYSPDRNSWGIVTAAKNRLLTATAIAPSDSRVTAAWNYMLCGETSCYWYWDGTEMWDSHPARACNLAVAQIDPIIGTGSDTVGPTIYIPQRQPYNPGAYEWNTTPETSDETIWTYVYDVSGLTSVNLKYRLNDSVTRSSGNYIYSYGTVYSVAMASKNIVSQTSPMPTYKALEYSATISGVNNKMVDYWVEATDGAGNITRSPIQHVYIGTGPTSDTTPPSCSITYPASGATVGGEISITANASDSGSGMARVEFFVNGTNVGIDTTSPYAVSWNTLGISNGTSRTITIKAYDVAGNMSSSSVTVTVNNSDPIVQTVHYYTSWTAVNIHYNNGTAWTTPPGTAMTSEGSGWWKKDLTTAGTTTFVFNNGSGTWDNNSTKNYMTDLRECWVKDSTIYSNNPGGGDVTPPTISFTSPTPAAGSTIARTVTIAVNAADETKLDRVEFKVGSTLVATVKAAPFTYDWDTSVLANGSYTVTATAFDAKGNSAYVTITFNVANSGRTVHYYNSSGWGSVYIHYNNGSGWTTAPGVLMAREGATSWWKLVNITGTNITCCFNNGSGTWDNNNTKNYVTALAECWVRNNAIYDAIPDIIPPTVAWSFPASGTTINGKINLTATASDDTAVSKVEFYNGSLLLGTITAAPYSVALDTATLANGSYTFTAKAYDNAGNTASATTTVTVQNSVTGVTVIRVFYNCGMGNNMYIRGNKPPLSWTVGKPMTWTTGNIWVYSTTEILENFEYKTLINDATWQTGANKTGTSGATNDNTPSF